MPTVERSFLKSIFFGVLSFQAFLFESVQEKDGVVHGQRKLQYTGYRVGHIGDTGHQNIGSHVDEGSTVNIIVSKGSEGDQTVVPNIVGRKVSVALQKLENAGLKADTQNVTYVHSDKYAKDYVVSQTYNSGQKVKRGTVVGYSVSLGPESTPTPEPTKEPTYSYKGSVVIRNNPFEEGEEPATIKLVLTQDGKSKPVFNGMLSYSDFPKTFDIPGWSENSGTIKVYKNNLEIDGPYSVEFVKEAN